MLSERGKAVNTSALTWYGGYVGVMWNADRNLHLISDTGATFCGIRQGLRQASRRDANHASFCHACNERAQAVRRDG